jgi:hypothetical protein
MTKQKLTSTLSSFSVWITSGSGEREKPFLEGDVQRANHTFFGPEKKLSFNFK